MTAAARAWTARRTQGRGRTTATARSATPAANAALPQKTR